MCVNVHEDAKYCDKEGYNSMSIYVVSIVQEPKESVTKSSGYDEKIILEGPKMDPSRIQQSIEPTTSRGIPLVPLKMEITSIEDVDDDSTQGKESSEEEKGDNIGSDGKELIEGEFYDTSDEFPSNEEDLKKKPSWKH